VPLVRGDQAPAHRMVVELSLVGGGRANPAAAAAYPQHFDEKVVPELRGVPGFAARTSAGEVKSRMSVIAPSQSAP
jgi:hypothetical protein